MTIDSAAQLPRVRRLRRRLRTAQPTDRRQVDAHAAGLRLPRALRLRPALQLGRSHAPDADLLHRRQRTVFSLVDSVDCISRDGQPMELSIKLY